jgi:hypothetical protein
MNEGRFGDLHAALATMTSLNRRSFLRSSCFAACAGALTAGDSLAAIVASRYTRSLAGPLPLAPAEETLLAFVQRYSREVRLVGAGALAKLRGAATREAHLLVEVSDSVAFDAALAGPTPFGGAFSGGNTLCFVRDGIEFTVENLLPEAFARRLTELATLKHIAFAQDALIYDPATWKLADPFGAEKSRTLKMVNITIAGGAAVGVAIRGRIESGRLGMKHGSVFANWQTRHLGLGANAGTAQALVETFLGKLATIAERTPPDAIQTLLRSRALSSALLRVLGVNTVEAIAEFDRLRPEISGEFSNAALWLALLLGPEIESEAADGAATTWLQRGTRFDVLRSRRALAAARRFLTSDS